MPIRPKSHQLEDRSRTAFQAVLPSAWVFRNKPSDYGIDGELELFESDGRSTGLMALIQLKGTEAVPTKLVRPFKIETVNYYYSLDLPVILVFWIEQSDEIFWTWATMVDPGLAKKNAKTISVTFPNRWGKDTPSEIERTLKLKRSLKNRTVPRPLTLELSGKIDDELSNTFLRYCILTPKLLQVVESNAHIVVSVQSDQVLTWFRGGPGFVIHNWKLETKTTRAKKLILCVVFLLSYFRLYDLAAELWASMPDLGEVIDYPEHALFAVQLLARAGAGNDLENLVEALLKKERQELIEFPIQAIYASAPLHRKRDLTGALLKIHMNMLKSAAAITRSIGAYNLARHYETENRAEARHYFEVAIRSSDFYKRKDYFWREIGGFLFNNRRYHAARRAYSYVKNELHDLQIALRLADAAMHCGDYKNAQRAFRKVSAQKINSRWELNRQTRMATEICEGKIKSIALSYCMSVLKIDNQVRTVRKSTGAPIAKDKISNEDVIGFSRKSLLLDALSGNAWYNLARANKLLGNDEDAMLCYLMAGACRTPDNEAWLEALLLASKLKHNLLPSLVGYLQLARAEEFARYLAEAAARSSDEPTRNVLISFGQLFAQNASSNATAEFRFHGKDNWKSILVSVG